MTEDTAQLPMLAFDRGGLSGAACFERWSDILASVFDVALPQSEAENFSGSMKTYHLGSLLVSDTAGSGVNFHRSGSTIARTSVEHFLVQVYLEGGFVGEADGKEMAMRAGDVCVLDLARPLATRASDFRNITIVMPRESLAPLVKSPASLHGLVLGGNSAMGSLLGGHIQNLYTQLHSMGPQDAQAAASGTAGLIAACLGPTFDARERAVAEIHAAVLERIRRFIDERLAAPTLDADLICRIFGLSRSALYRLFEPHGGLVAYIRQRRLNRAFADLVTQEQGRERIIDVALRWGFGSEGSFSRAFRAAYGISPSQAGQTADSIRRLLARDGTAEDAGAADRLLQRWMHSLYPA